MNTVNLAGKLVLFVVPCISLGLIVALYFLNFSTSSYVDFDRKNLGVVYSAYVKKPSELTRPFPKGWKSYSMKSVKAMLDVASGKFSRVATYGVGADIVPYIKNRTYYDSFSQIYAAEAAGLINNEKNETILKMIVGIWQSENTQQMESEIGLALESSEKANEIFPGTVEGLVFSSGDTLKDAKQTLDNIRSVKADADQLELKVGTRQNCDKIANEILIEDGFSFTQIAIVKESDFIICEVYPAAENDYMLGTELTVEVNLLMIRDRLEAINPNIEVMGQTGWPSKGVKAWENRENMKEFWEAMNKFAGKYNFTMWMMEAFDNPWKTWAPREAHFGWWKLRSNSEIERREGYQEKIIENYVGVHTH